MALPLILKPKKNFLLSRVGRDFDGGYLVCNSTIQKTKTLVSFGINDDWSFEESFKKKNQFCKIFCYDENNIIKLLIKKVVENLIYFPLRFNLDFYKYVIKIFSFLKIKKKINFYKKKIYYNDLKNILKKFKHNNIFLKIDIEGSEYRILDEILINKKKIIGLVIEFHDFDYHKKTICKFIKKFPLKLTHIHPNNFSTVDKNNDPLVIECTFEKHPIVMKNKNILPNKLDMKNNPFEKESKIKF